MAPLTSLSITALALLAASDEVPANAPQGEESFPLWLILVIPVAIFVYYFGSTRAQRSFRSSRLEPKGRRYEDGDDAVDGELAAIVSRAERRDVVTPIAEAQAVPVMVRGTIVNADGNLGGAPGRECVWRNRARARRDAAVAAELVSIADDSGRALIEHLDRARVIAPSETIASRRESVSLYKGDEIEVIGRFAPERIGEDPDPTQLVYGTFGTAGPIQVRVLRRPDHEREGVGEDEDANAMGDKNARAPDPGAVASDT